MISDIDKNRFNSPWVFCCDSSKDWEEVVSVVVHVCTYWILPDRGMNLATRSLTPIICSATKFSFCRYYNAQVQDTIFFFPLVCRCHNFFLQKFSSMGSYEKIRSEPVRSIARRPSHNHQSRRQYSAYHNPEVHLCMYVCTSDRVWICTSLVYFLVTARSSDMQKGLLPKDDFSSSGENLRAFAAFPGLDFPILSLWKMKHLTMRWIAQRQDVYPANIIINFLQWHHIESNLVI